MPVRKLKKSGISQFRSSLALNSNTMNKTQCKYNNRTLIAKLYYDCCITVYP